VKRFGFYFCLELEVTKEAHLLFKVTVSMKGNCCSKNMNKPRKILFDRLWQEASLWLTWPDDNHLCEKSQNEIKNQYRNTQKINPVNDPSEGDHEREVPIFPVSW